MKRFKYVLMLFLLIVILGGGCFFVLREKEVSITKVLESDAYSYLSKEAKDYIQSVYEETGDIILTEKNKEENVPYLNPSYIEYLSMDAEAKQKVGEIPTIYSVDMNVVGSGGNTPSSFDLRDVNGDIYVSDIKDQGSLNLCWSFTTIEQAESFIRTKGYNYNDVFSTRQLDYATSTDGIADYENENGVRSIANGGNFLMASLVAYNGLTFKNDDLMPFDLSQDEKELKDVLNYDDSRYELNASVWMPTIEQNTSSTDIANIVSTVKEYVMDNGGAYVATQAPGYTCSSMNYDGEMIIRTDDSCQKEAGHAMQIIGWDDDYSYSYCKTGSSHDSNVQNCASSNLVSGTGAWILRNSWGEDSYPYVYLAFDSIDDEIYIMTDLSDMADRMWDNNYHADFSTSFADSSYYVTTSDTQTFTKTINTSEQMTRVKFFAYGQGAYNLTITTGGQTYTNIAQAVVDYPGIYTFDLVDENIMLEDNTFSVKIASTSDAKFMKDSISVFTWNNLSPDEYFIHSKDQQIVFPASQDDYTYRLYSYTKGIYSWNPIDYSLIDAGDNDVTGDYLTVDEETNIVSKNDVNTFFTISSDIPEGSYNLYLSYWDEVLEVIPVTIGSLDSYQVRFYANDGTNTSTVQTVGIGEDFNLDLNPFSYTGHIFVGWFDDLNNNYTDGQAMDPLDGPLTLYADWIPIQYVVEFNSNGGIGSMDDQVIDYGDHVNLDPNMFEKEGYTFAGWNTAADGSGTSYDNEASISNLSSTDGDVITLYAQWTVDSGDTYTISFNSNNGIGSMADQELEENETGTLVSNTFTRTGYIFTGWNTMANGSGTPYANGGSIGPLTADITLFAQWLPIQYVIEFNSNGGNGFMEDQVVDYDDRVNLDPNTFTHSQEAFAGWNTAADGTGTPYDDEAEIFNLSFVDNDVITLYAQWTSSIIIGDSYVITFNSNNGTGSMPDQMIDEDEIASLNLNTFTRSGYQFAGWNTSADGSGTPYANGGSIGPLTADITLYAQWSQSSYQVIFNANGGGGSMPPQPFDSNQTFALNTNTFTWPGYTFTGWNTMLDGGGTSYTNGATIGPLTNSITLYAQWSQNIYQVTFNANGGSGTMDAQSFTYNQNVGLEKNKFTKSGYQFAGWNTSVDGMGTSYDDEEVIGPLTESVTLYAQWDVEHYQVIFEANGGSGTMEPQSFDYNQTVILKGNTYTNNGYTFAGWNTSADGSGTSYTDGANLGTLTGDITLYAQWNAIIYYVTFNANGGSGTMDPQSFTCNQNVILKANTFENAGYEFIGWNTKANGSGDAYGDEANLGTMTGNITLYAQWNQNSYQVTFNANGGNGDMTPQNFTYNQSVTLKGNTFTKTGYVFAGWNTVANGSGTSYANKATIGPLTESITLYAQWNLEYYQITFNANGGSGTMSSQSFTYSQSVTLNTNNFIRPGYTFTGWTASEDGTGTSYGNGATIGPLTESITLYAQWSQNIYQVTFQSNGGSGTMSSQTFTYNQNVTLSYNNFVYSGYVFDGWNTQANGTGTSYGDGATIGPLTESITLYAQWELDTYVIRYRANNGTGSMPDQEFTYNQSVILNDNDFTREGYTFAGWNTMANGSGTSYANRAIIGPLTESVTLYAQWNRITYIISFHSNNGIGSMSDQTINYGETINLSANSFEREGYTFTGWNTSPDGSGTDYANEASIGPLTGSITLYAQWDRITYTITYNPNEGSGVMEPQVFDYQESKELTTNAYTRYGYTFAGWNTRADGTGTSYINEATVGPLTESMFLYAQWNIITYTISFNANTGTGTMPAQTINHGAVNALNANTFTKEDYTFEKWTTQADGSGTSYGDGADIGPLENNITLYAQWKLRIYTVTYYANGGEGNMESQEIQPKTAFNVSSHTFTRDGYAFTGWNTQANGEGTSYTDGQAVASLTDDLSLYAQWRPFTYTVTYHSNNGTGSMEDQEFTYDVAQNLSSNQFEKEGYHFTGWNTSADGTGTVYSNGQQVINLTNIDLATITLYAQWDENPLYVINHYSVDEVASYIDLIEPKTSITTLIRYIELHSSCSVVVDLSPVGGNTIFTGSKTKIYQGDQLLAEYTNIVRGDINGDAKVSALDYVKVKNHIMGTNSITDTIQRLAADANNDTKISALDYIRIKNIIMNGGN